MTTPDPFTPHGSSHQPQYPAPGYGAYQQPQYPPPGYGAYQQPQYPPPGYDAYQQPPYSPRQSLDGVSLAAFVTGLLGAGPVAVLLGAIGIARTAKQVRSGRWMAWTGLVFGVLGTLVWIAIISLFGWMKDAIDANAGYTVPTHTNSELEEPAVDSYGDDPYLDGLWDSCDGGNMEACDQLFIDAPAFSGYEDFAYECGNEGRKLTQWTCADY